MWRRAWQTEWKGCECGSLRSRVCCVPDLIFLYFLISWSGSLTVII